MDFKKVSIQLHLAIVRFRIRVRKVAGIIRCWWLLARTLIQKECFYGPFTGEFGHLLGHNLPFIAYLYSKGVKVHFCGLSIHKPFFVDQNGNTIVSEYLEVRDYFRESAPNCTAAPEPDDVKALTKGFRTRARSSGKPYWNFEDEFFYFNVFRWWVLRNRLSKTFDLSKYYGNRKSRSAVIFPRRWNPNFPEHSAKQLLNNGLPWNYREVALAVSPFFDKVHVIGHPVFSSVDFDSFDNVEVKISNNNKEILQLCSDSSLIITPHSGSVYLGEYTNTQVLIIYQGGRQVGDISTTTAFKEALGTKFPFAFAFSLEEIKTLVQTA